MGHGCTGIHQALLFSFMLNFVEMNKLPLKTDILLKRLQTFEFLRGLDHEILATLAKSAVWKVFASDAVVFWEGDTETNRHYSK